MKRYPDRIPIYVEKSPDCKSDIAQIEKHKYLVPFDMSMGNFMYVIRKNIKLKPNEAIFLFINKNTLAPTSSILGELYKQYKSDDKMLHVCYTSENTFG